MSTPQSNPSPAVAVIFNIPDNHVSVTTEGLATEPTVIEVDMLGYFNHDEAVASWLSAVYRLPRTSLIRRKVLAAAKTCLAREESDYTVTKLLTERSIDEAADNSPDQPTVLIYRDENDNEFWCENLDGVREISIYFPSIWEVAEGEDHAKLVLDTISDLPTNSEIRQEVESCVAEMLESLKSPLDVEWLTSHTMEELTARQNQEVRQSVAFA